MLDHACRLYSSHPVTPARSCKIGNRSALKNLHHELGIDHTDDTDDTDHADHTDHLSEV